MVLDASVALSWCFEDEITPGSTAILKRVESSEAFVPSVWPLEVTNVLRQAERRGRVTRPIVIGFLDALGALPLRVVEIGIATVFRDVMGLAWSHELTTYDASYLELALRMGLPLATLDSSMRGAALAAGIDVLPA